MSKYLIFYKCINQQWHKRNTLKIQIIMTISIFFMNSLGWYGGHGINWEWYLTATGDTDRLIHNLCMILSSNLFRLHQALKQKFCYCKFITVISQVKSFSSFFFPLVLYYLNIYIYIYIYMYLLLKLVIFTCFINFLHFYFCFLCMVCWNANNWLDISITWCQLQATSFKMNSIST